MAANLICAGGTESLEAPWLESFRFDHACVCIAPPCSPIDSLWASMTCSLATAATAFPGSPGQSVISLTQLLPLLFLYWFAHFLRRAQAEEAQRARRAALMAAEQGFEGEVYDTGSHWSVCLKSLGQCRTSQGFRIVCAWFCSLRVGSWQMFFEFPIRKIPNSPRQATSCDQAICLVWLCHRKRAMDMVPHPVPKVYSSQHVSDMIRYDLCIFMSARHPFAM